MGHVELLGIHEDMTTTKLLALHDAAGWAFDLWAHLCEAHVQPGLGYRARFRLRERVWGLVDDPRVPLAHRLVLGMTLDRAVVRAAEYARAADDMRLSPAGVHWSSMAKFVEDGGVAGYPMFGFAAHASSAPTFSEPYGEDDDDGNRRWRPIDPVTVYDVYAEVG